MPLDALLSPPALVAVGAGYLACVAAVALRYRPGVAGVVGFALLGVATSAETSLYPPGEGVHHSKLMPAAVLVTQAIALGRGGPKAETVAREAACGVLAGAYVLAGIAKLRAHGLAWVSGANLPLLIAERAVDAPTFGPLRTAVASSPGLLWLVGALALVLELGGFAFLWRAARPAYAVAVIAMHASIGALMGYPYPEWMLMAAGLAWASRRERA